MSQCRNGSTCFWALAGVNSVQDPAPGCLSPPKPQRACYGAPLALLFTAEALTAQWALCLLREAASKRQRARVTAFCIHPWLPSSCLASRKNEVVQTN